MLLHVRLLVEPLPAVLAGIRPRVGMDEQVRGERGGPLEALAADFATEASLLRMFTRRRHTVSKSQAAYWRPQSFCCLLTCEWTALC